ncbi:MAG: CRISPR-associated endonuclease Cas3'' [Armatimonadota bacterium]|nr:CRISPR-associated endonuclease Cas3'' [Armatimonadota bacterium]
MDLTRAALALWAKSGDPYHPLLAHMLDTAAVALAVLDQEPATTRRLYGQDLSLPEEDALRFVAFLVGLHDLGKASPVFQATWSEGAARVRRLGLSWDEELVKESRVAHGVLTDLYVRELLEQLGLPGRVARKLAEGLGAHHGFLAPESERKSGRNHVKAEPRSWGQARRLLVMRLGGALGVPQPIPLKIQDASPESVLRVMALASFADWIASDPSLFPYGRDPGQPEYWRRAQELAKKALAQIPWPKAPRPVEKPFRCLFHFQPNALQKAIPRLLEGAEAPVLLLVEAPMGVGKTEAALYAYHLLQRRLDHRGLYVALPTQATANGLFARVRDFLEKMEARVPLDLQLQHGAAALQPEYAKLLERARPAQVHDHEGEVEGAVAASAWFSARKRAMLSGHGVGTLDQALLGVLKVKHHFVRLWGLMNRVVVLDEVHAYDTYTSGLLQALLMWLRVLGSSVILLTATLPRRKRHELLAAWGTDGGALPHYPRVTAFAGQKCLGAERLAVGTSRTLHLTPAPVDVAALAETLRTRLPGALGAIVNTVDRAQALYQALGVGERLTVADLMDQLGERPAQGPWPQLWRQRDRIGDIVVGKRVADGTLVVLLHARFPAEERAVREGVTLALFGKHGPRPERAILVATQVAEQSLDLDCDLLYTDLAPVDLVVQRAGRLHRHQGRCRPAAHAVPALLVGGVERGPEFDRGLYWNAVYEDYILLSTWLALKGRYVLRVPEDLEGLLEEVYERRPEQFPADLRSRAEESWKAMQARWEQQAQVARNLALSSLETLLSRTDPAALAADFRLDDEAEDPRTQSFLTRLGKPGVPVVPLYRMGDGWFLDPGGKRPARLRGELSDEEALALWSRAVRLSRSPIPEVLLSQDPPPAWRRSGPLRGLRPLEVGKVFSTEKGGLSVELDPELGVRYVVRSPA